jgi:hypothetical protein
LVEQHKEDFDKIFAICPTENVNGFYQKNGFISPEYIFDEYSEDWVNALITKMTNMNKGKKAETARHVLLILDDIVVDANFTLSEEAISARKTHLYQCHHHI